MLRTPSAHFRARGVVSSIGRTVALRLCKSGLAILADVQNRSSAVWIVKGMPWARDRFSCSPHSIYVMAHRTSTVWLGLMLVVAGCFNPTDRDPIGASTDPGKNDQPNPEPDPGPSCGELEDSCIVANDCCDYDDTPQDGSALCIGSADNGYVCREVCTSAEGCGSGCCGAMTGELEFGFCAEPSYCEQGTVFRPSGCHVGDTYECAGDDLLTCATQEVEDCDALCVRDGWTRAADPACGLGSGTQLCMCE